MRKKSVSFFAYLSLGKLYLEQDRPEKALSELEAAVKMNPRIAEPHLFLAKAYREMGQTEKILSCLERYLFLGGSKEEAEEIEALLKK